MPPAPGFVDASAASGVDVVVSAGGTSDKMLLLEAIGAGVCLLDADGDGRLDLVVVDGSTVEEHRAGRPGRPPRLYRNLGGMRFADRTAASGLVAPGWGQGCAVGDWDGDGRPDLFVTGHGDRQLYRNEGGTFREVTGETGVGGREWSTSAAFADVDLDGDLDLYVATYFDLDLARPPHHGQQLPSGRFRACRRGVPVACGPYDLAPQRDVYYRNEGDGRFTAASDEVGVDPEPLYGLGVVFSDLDLDGRIDLFVGNDTVRRALYRNLGGHFEELGRFAGAAYSNVGGAQASMGVDAADYDGDGDIDLVATNFSEDYDSLLAGNAPWLWEDVSFAAGIGAGSIPFLAWGVRFADLDQDGRDDLVIANGHVYPQVDLERGAVTYRQRTRFYRNLGGGRFAEQGEGVGLGEPLAGRGLAVGDLDGDLRLDLVVANLDDRVRIYRNGDALGAGHALLLALSGRDSNRDAIGAIVTVEAGGSRQVKVRTSGGSFLSAGDPRLHFGLGSAARVDRIEIRWPSGRRSEVRDVAVPALLEIDEESGVTGRLGPGGEPGGV